jgi:Flavodoxin domain
MRTLFAGGGVMLLSSEGHALKLFPNPGKRKWAILFGSKYGSTRDASLWISEGMGGVADVFDVRENPDLSSFDGIIVGSGIYFGRTEENLNTYLAKNVGSISSRVKAVFVVCGAAGKPPAKEYADNLAKLCQTSSVLRRELPGRMTKRLLTGHDAKLLEDYFKGRNVPFAEYDRLERKDCLQFGEEISKTG